MRRIRVPIPAAGIITIAGLLLYGVMIGMSLATMRAIWMMVILLVAQMFGKSYDMPTAMGLALFVMLLCNPVRILDSGMQLSYMAIAGILYINIPAGSGVKGNYALHRMRNYADTDWRTGVMRVAATHRSNLFLGCWTRRWNPDTIPGRKKYRD